MFENELHVFMSSSRAQSNAELRANQAVLECQNHSRTIEAKCEVLLAIQAAHSEKVVLEVRQRHDALEGVEDRLSAARTAEAALYRDAQSDFNSLASGHASELVELQESAAREVQCAQAEVAVHEEVLQRYTSETAAQAAGDQAELQSAVARASTLADERYQAELLRERDAHRQAVSQLESNAEGSVSHQLQFALNAREIGLTQERRLNEAKMFNMSAEGRQLYVQLQCALHEINVLHARLGPAANASASDILAAPATIYEVVASEATCEEEEPH